MVTISPQGNAVLWKPSDTAVLSNFTIYKIMREVGVPGEVVSFLPADGPVFGDTITKSPHMAAINFTGSVPYVVIYTRIGMWKNIFFCELIWSRCLSDG